MRFDSLDSYFACESLTGAGRVDVFMEATEKLGEDVKDLIQAKCPRAAVSESYVLELVDAAQGPVIMVEFIDMKDN